MENDKMKTPRASQSRDSVKRPTTWTPPSSLDAPRPKDGFKHRWIRLELVRADEYPGESYSTIQEGKYAGVIGHGGLALARIPVELAKARDEYFAKRTKEREDAINNDVYKDQHPSMPINSERQTRVTFGGTNKK
jgi:hypothetical protein